MSNTYRLAATNSLYTRAFFAHNKVRYEAVRVEVLDGGRTPVRVEIYALERNEPPHWVGYAQDVRPALRAKALAAVAA